MRRLVLVLVGAVVVVAGLGVHTLAPAGFVSDAAGDVLYAVLIHLIVAFLAPRWPSWLSGSVALAWCVAVELFQLTGIPAAWGFPLTLVFGSGFAATDLVFYAIGVALAAGGDATMRRRESLSPGAVTAPDRRDRTS